jgi:hypothetical protein
LSLSPPRLRRRLGHGGISLLVLATSSSLLWSASSGTASAASSAPTPVCSQGVCEVTFGPTDVPGVQTWTVPAHVTAVTATVDGAGGGSWDGSLPGVTAGAGGETTGTFSVQAKDQLSLVVGGAGESAGDSSSGAAGGYGGGGAGGSNALRTGAGTGGGGGGSFLFGDDGALVLAAGGGGGASADRSGGAGGSALGLATKGDDGDGSSGGQAGSIEANGLGGMPNGGAGSGAVTSTTALPLGGQGGDTLPDPSVGAEPGAGGGGGYHAGGGGGGSAGQVDGSSGYGAGGGGGSGFAASSVTAVGGAAGVRARNGQVTLAYSIPQPITFTSSFDGIVVGPKTYSVSADGGGQPPVLFTVDPSTTNAACSIDGRSFITFDHVGTCVIAADEAGDDQHVAGHKLLSFPVRMGSQSITFTPLATKGSIGDQLTLKATADSGLPVAIDLEPTSTAGACSLTGTSLTLTGVGTCAVTASQAGNDDYSAAQPVTQSIAVSRVATTPVLTFDQDTPVFGQDVTASVTVAGSVAGSVQFLVDDRPVGFPVALDPEGTASVTLPANLEAGNHPVKVTFSPTDSATYAGSSAVRSLPVAKAKTNIDVTVRADKASVKIIAVAPGKGVPGGTVVFTFGDTVSVPVDVVRGEATYAGSIPAGAVVKVVYSGDDDFAGSATSTLRRNPVLTATLTSASEKSPAGWYRSAVTVTFHCEPGSAPLTDDCPEPVTLSADGGSQDVTETIAADDGGVATVSVTGINIDTTKPEVDALNVEEGDRFFSSAPEAGCSASDSLSGVLRCSASRTVEDKEVTYSVTATDQAGNVATRTVHATTYNRGITDAPYADGAYTVRAGQTYTLVAKSSKRPQVLKPVVSPKKPSKSGDKFKATANHDEWALGYTIPTSLKPGKTYNLGIKTTSRYTIKITVTA